MKKIIANKDFNICVKKGSEYEVITENECTYTFKDDEGFIVNLSKFYFTVKADEVVKKQQTAVEWLVEELKKKSSDLSKWHVDLIKQSKQMEQQLIIDAFFKGCECGEMFNNERRAFYTDAKQYYNETFGTDETTN